jgi:hypothetical protein
MSSNPYVVRTDALWGFLQKGDLDTQEIAVQKLRIDCKCSGILQQLQNEYLNLLATTPNNSQKLVQILRNIEKNQILLKDFQEVEYKSVKELKKAYNKLKEDLTQQFNVNTQPPTKRPPERPDPLAIETEEARASRAELLERQKETERLKADFEKKKSDHEKNSENMRNETVKQSQSDEKRKIQMDKEIEEYRNLEEQRQETIKQELVLDEQIKKVQEEMAKQEIYGMAARVQMEAQHQETMKTIVSQAPDQPPAAGANPFSVASPAPQGLLNQFGGGSVTASPLPPPSQSGLPPPPLGNPPAQGGAPPPPLGQPPAQGGAPPPPPPPPPVNYVSPLSSGHGTTQPQKTDNTAPRPANQAPKPEKILDAFQKSLQERLARLRKSVAGAEPIDANTEQAQVQPQAQTGDGTQQSAITGLNQFMVKSDAPVDQKPGSGAAADEWDADEV